MKNKKEKTMITSSNDLIKEYNRVCKEHLERGSALKDLTDSEFIIWIAGQTYKFGRDWKDSIANAKHHLKNRERAERLFSVKHSDTLGAC